ncbi:MAG: EamA family transporter [Granulosicoccus sp.]|nr:EamA family transporter [Granulosicoccus sp.]
MSPHHLALLVLVNALWGFNFLAGKIGTEQFGPLLFSAVRFAVVLLLLFPWLRMVRGQMRLIVLIGLCLGAGHYSIMFYALYLGDNISSIAIAAQLTVPFSTILAIVFLRERIGFIRIFAIAMSFLGVVVISFEPIGPEHLVAMVAATIAAFVMAIAAILMRRLQGVGVFNLQAWIALVSTVVLTLLSVLIESPGWEDFSGRTVVDFWTPVYSAIGATIVGHGSLYYLLQRYEVNSVAPFITLATLFAIGYSIVLMDDVLTLRIIVGGLLTLLGVTIIALRNARQSTPSSLRVPR